VAQSHTVAISEIESIITCENVLPESRQTGSCEEYFLPTSWCATGKKYAGCPSALVAEIRGGHQSISGRKNVNPFCKPYRFHRPQPRKLGPELLDKM
jgi:hypothetical protein